MQVTFQPKTGRKTITTLPLALYLFAGIQRKSDVASFLKQGNWEVVELDILRNQHHDLTKSKLRQRILDQIRSGKYDAIIASPPCSTFSRVTYANDNGPRPSRSLQYPRGFPWIQGEKKRIVEIGNILADFTFEAVLVQAELGRLAVIEFPEDLGAVKNGRWSGIRPSSIWQWPAVTQLRKLSQFREFGIRQCDYGANYVKPTRIVMLGKPAEGKFFEGPPFYDEKGFYLGPIPATDTRALGLTTLAKKKGEIGFRTTGTASWPAELCKWVADSIILNVVKKSHMEQTSLTSELKLGEQENCGEGPTEAYPITRHPKDYWTGGRGKPRTTYTLGKTKEFHDGCGLTSPGRWQAEQRVFPQGAAWENLRESLYQAMTHYIPKGQETPWGKTGIQKVLLQLCCSKEIVAIPEDLILQGRKIILDWLENRVGDFDKEEPDIAERQPFVLKALHLLLREMRDADYEIVHTMKSGVTAGILFPLPRTPAIYEEQTKWRLQWDPLATPMTVAGNYSSLEKHTKEVKTQFKEEEQIGLMREYDEKDFFNKFGQNCAVSALAVIEEDGGSKIRVIHDGTHKTMVNHKIKCRDKLRCPGVPEMHTIMRERRMKKQICMSLKADFTKAHRWVKVISEEHGMLACQIEPGKIWANESETFGVGSAAYWWSRLSGALVRAVHGILGHRWILDILLYADDIEITMADADEREGAVMAIFIMLSLGAPFKWKKFRGGHSLDWVGFHIDNTIYSIGLSEKRAEWLVKWMETLIQEQTVEVHVFAGGLGRLNFAAMALFYEKPWLGPLYSWSATIQQSGKQKATIPWGIKLILKWLCERIRNEGRLMRTPDLPQCRGELFRTDAKAENGRATLGGWECRDGTSPGQARWWFLEIKREDYPWVFMKHNDPQRVIATLELMATLIAIIVFDYREENLWSSTCTISADTDNQGITLAMHKFMSTKWPLTAVLAELGEQLRQRRLELHLSWLRRDLNSEADAITNEEFTIFDPERRIQIVPQEIKWVVLPKIMEWSKQIYEHTEEQRVLKGKQTSVDHRLEKRRKISAAQRLRTTDPW
jgi:hypothetical protein